MADDIKNKKATNKEAAKKELQKKAQKRNIKVEKNNNIKPKEDKRKIKKAGVKKSVKDDTKDKEKEKKKSVFYDYSFIFIVFVLIAFGLIMIYSASSYTAELKFKNSAYFVWRQMKLASAGFVLMIVISFTPYKVWTGKFIKVRIPYFIHGVATALVGLVLIIGRDANGARRWINIAGVKFQPSELVKISIIILMAYYLVKYKDVLHGDDKKRAEKYLWLLFGMVMVPTVLVLLENMSTAIIMFLIAFCISFLGTSYRKLHTLGAIIIGFALIFSKPFVRILYEKGFRDYHLIRLLVWAEPEKFSRDGGYQVMQGLYAIGSGNIFGKGLGEGMQKFFLPESQNDMIFAIIVEELGLFGAALLLGAFAFIIYRMVKIAFSIKDLEGVYLVVGILIHISLQVILNIAVVTGVLPNTGVSLPFISYGGTSIIILLAEMGIVLSVARSIKMDY